MRKPIPGQTQILEVMTYALSQFDDIYAMDCDFWETYDKMLLDGWYVLSINSVFDPRINDILVIIHLAKDEPPDS